MSVARSTPRPDRAPASRRVGAGVAFVIAALVALLERMVGGSDVTLAGLVVGPAVGAWLARRVRPGEPVLGWLTLRMAVAAVVIGAFTTSALWAGGDAVADLPGVLFIGLLGLVWLGVPMLLVTVACAAAWIAVMRRLGPRPALG